MTGTDIVDGHPVLRLPAPPDLTVREHQGRRQILDRVRGRWVVLTPEEWVRQHVVHMLRSRLGVPEGLITIEREVVWEDTRRRVDVMVADRRGSPWMVVECKAPTVTLDQATLDQAGRYLSAMGAPFALVTNGWLVVGWEVSGNGRHRILQELPHYPER